MKAKTVIPDTERDIEVIMKESEAIAIKESIGHSSPNERKSIFSGNNYIEKKEVFSELYSALKEVLYEQH